MRLLVSSAVVLGLAVSMYPDFAPAQETEISRRHHPWGGFKPGAWKQVKVETETLDEKGVVTNRSTTETETTLMKVEDDGVTLLVEVVVEVAGKRFEAEPEIIKQGFHGILVNQDLKVKEPVDGQITIEGQKVPCKILELELPGTTGTTVTSIYYSHAVAPYILKRKSVTTDPEGKTTLSEKTVDVVALDMPWKVSAEIKRSALVRAVRKDPKGTITTWAFTSTDVPGGVISESSKELDKDRRLIRRSTLKLTGYGLEPDEKRTGLFGRKRSGRLRKPRPDPGESAG